MSRQRSWMMGTPWLLMGALALTACGDDPLPCDEPGRACTWLGMEGEEGFNGDGRDRLDTKLYWTMDMLFASDGTVWFHDWNNHLVRRVLENGTVETVVGWTDPIFPGDGAPDERGPDGALGTDVQLNHPTDFAELSDGTILLMAWHNHKLRVIDPDTGRVRIMCGAGAGFAGDGGPDNLALFRQPKALEVDDEGNIYILDQANVRIRRIDANGTIDTIAGNGARGFAGDSGPAVDAEFGFEGGSNPEPSGGMVVHDGTLFVADTLNNRIRAVNLTTGIIETIAGTGEAGYTGDGGPAMAATFDGPRDLEIGPEGDLYIADTDNNVVRAIDIDGGVVRTVAGTGEIGLDPNDGRFATETRLKRPFGIEFDADGHLYIADTINSRILRVAK